MKAPSQYGRAVSSANVIIDPESMSSVRTLKIALNDINSESAIEKLKQSLLHSHLKELDLSYNPIGNAGMKVLATALSSASTLESLNLMACDFNHIGAQPLMQVL